MYIHNIKTYNICYSPIKQIKKTNFPIINNNNSTESIKYNQIPLNAFSDRLLFCGNKKNNGIDYNNLASFSQHLEEKLKNSINIEPLPCPLSSSLDIARINKTFKQDNIYMICNGGVSLNNALDYLSIKKQITLAPKKHDAKKAFFIDRLSLEYLETLNSAPFLSKDNIAYSKFKKDVENENIKLYTYGLSEKEEKDLSKKFYKLINNSLFHKPKITKIEKPNTNKAKYPNANQIRAAIYVYSKYQFPYISENKKPFRVAMCKYLDENLIAFSYANLTHEVKKSHEILENYLGKPLKDCKNIEFLIPTSSRKSYDVIAYLYATINNIPQEKFKYINDITYNPKKTYVILDDLSLSGQSIVRMEEPDFWSKLDFDQLIFMPIFCSTHAKDVIDSYFTNTKITVLPNHLCDIDTDSVKNLTDKEKNVFQIIYKSMWDMSNFASTIALPYMIPDNSDESFAYIGRYFLNHDTTESNKPSLFIEDYRDKCKEMKRYENLYILE